MISSNTTLAAQAQHVLPAPGSCPNMPQRALGSSGGVRTAAAFLRPVAGTGVFGYLRTTTVKVIDDAVPGISAWSPPT